ncbi:MAG TPA: hypothetical protein VIT20_09465 [Propionibacteriaceae bacterium]
MLIPLHGIASRHDLPLPFSFVVVGAGLALVVSFVVLIFAWRRPRFSTVGGLPLPRLTAVLDRSWVRVAAQLLILATYAWAALAMTFGQDRLTNPSFGFVYVWMWVGLVPLSLLFGQFWRTTNPLRTLHRGLSAIARIDPEQGLLTLPRRIGVWPAAVGLFGFAWLELVQPDRTTLAVLRVWALAWLVVMILGAIVFGARWIGAADPFEAYARAVAQLSPLRRVGEQFRLIEPLAGLTAWRPPPGAAALVSVLLGSTAFDSFANTSWWIQTVQNSDVITAVWASGGLLVMIAIVVVTFSLAAAWMGRYGSLPSSAYPRQMAGSLVPIVIGYAVAHYATLLVIEGQRTAINFSDPLGRGWNVFGSAEMGVNSAIFAHPTAIAVVQLLAIVLGHVIGIIAAHEKAVALLPADRALRGQWPMLVVMVGYTCAGLVLLFSP